MLFEQYNKLNLSSKQRILIWELKKRGFGSEITAMLFAMLYCLDNKIELKLSSKYSNIAFERGWTDYFESFCDECDFWFFNNHYGINLIKQVKQKNALTCLKNFFNVILSQISSAVQ